MTGKAQVVKHLEIIQGVVNRLGHDSFLIKGWSMAVLVAGIIFISRNQIQSEWIILAFILPVLGFWVLDGYFLRKERMFIEIYNEIRQQEITDFEMNHEKHANKPKCGRLSSMFSETLLVFYATEIIFVLVVFLTTMCW